MKKKKSFSLTPANARSAAWLRWLNLFVVALSLLALLAPYVNPKYFWPVAIIGLATPALLLIHLFFVLFWSLRKKLYALLSLGVIIMSWSAVNGAVGFAFAKNPPNDQLKVVTFNVRRLQSYPKHNQTVTPDRFKSQIQQLNPDVLCLQEFVVSERERQPYLQVLKELGLQYIIHDQDRSSLVIAARYPLQSIENHYYQNHVNGYQIAELDYGDQKVNIINIHLRSNYITGLTNQLADKGDLKEKETWRNIRQVLSRYKAAAITRTQQAENIAQTLARFHDPNIICGDFNDTGQSYAYHQLKGNRKDAFLTDGRSWGSTYAGKIPGLRIDYILYNPALRVSYCRRGTPGFSDHRPVVAYFDL